MSDDRDLAALLPDPPPPRPARRDAAIAAAMERFDGGELKPAPKRAAASSFWATLRRPQFGMVVTACLVAVIAMPVWFSGDPRIVPPPASAPAPKAEQPADRARAPIAAADPVAAPAPPAETPTAQLASPAAEPAQAKPGADARALEQSPQPAERMAKSIMAENLAPPAPAPAPPPPPPPPPAATMAAPPAVAAPRAEQMADADDSAGSIVVTGSRVGRAASRAARPAPAPRESFRAARQRTANPCTVDDPNRNLDNCTRTLERAVRNDAARAHVAQGLSRAWAGDSAGAIAAFDQAIAAAPRSGFAYLNRGLAYRRSGNAAKADADLDRAVRLDPDYRSAID